MMSFDTSMSCDDICLWLRQNDVTDDDVQVFKSISACFYCMYTDTSCKYTYLMFSVHQM